MDQDKPWALVPEVGRDGFLEDGINIVKQHFNYICYKDFLQNTQLYGPKIQALFSWAAEPPAEPSLLKLLPSLKVVSNGGVGVDHLDVPYITSLGVKVANTPGVVSDATADMGMALLLASARMVLEGHQFSIDPNTSGLMQDMMGVEVTGSTLGIVGMGDIGYKIARRAKGFEMKILYHNRRRRSAADEQAVGATYCQSLEELLKKSDFVMLVVNLTSETKHLIKARQLSQMKPTATLVNISRGYVVDQDALVEALQSKTIRAAALDVTYPEPLPRDHPLLRLPNVLITPHIGTNTMATAIRMYQLMVDNAVAAVNNLPIPHEVKCN